MSDRFTFVNASVLEPRTGQLRPECTVTIEEGTIRAVEQGARPAASVPRLDLGGAVLMPGLIDCHVHVTVVTSDVWGMAEWSPAYVTARAAGVLKGMLDRGFTTVRDVGGCDFGLARAVSEGHLAGPRIVYGGKMLSQTGGAGEWRGPGRIVYDPHYYTPTLAHLCDGVAEVRKAAREEIRRGASHLKLYLSGAVDAPSDRLDATQFSLSEIGAAVEEAEAANIYVAGHAYTSRAINRGLAAGVRTIEHGNLMDASSPPLFLEHGAYYIPTLVTYHALAEHGLEQGVAAEALAKLPLVESGGRQALELCHRAGVPIAYGSDLLGEMHREQSFEFTLRAEVQPAADIIRSATTVGAQVLGMEGQIGEIAPGAQADLLVLDADPLLDVRVLSRPERHVQLVMQRGKLVRNSLGSG
ncbi:MAG TPA: amidohydrolase family protein [Candidatus Dormibacteraeota bacterium]